MDTAIMAADKKLVYIAQDREAYELYWMHEKARKDLSGQLSYARDEGIERGVAQGIVQGRAEGMAQGMVEVARKMKARGDSFAAIAEVTSLSPESIEKL